MNDAAYATHSPIAVEAWHGSVILGVLLFLLGLLDCIGQLLLFVRTVGGLDVVLT